MKANEFHEIFNLSYDGDFSDIPRISRATRKVNQLQLTRALHDNLKKYKNSSDLSVSQNLMFLSRAGLFIFELERFSRLSIRCSGEVEKF